MKVRPILPLVFFVVGLLALASSPRTACARQPGPAAGQTAAGGPYYALVIGNDEYVFLPKVETAAKDARAVERVLRETYGFQTRLLINATRSEIVAALSDYGRQLGADASLLIYYAGHGHKDDKTGKAYWLPVGATRENVSVWIAADEITNGIRAVPARHVLVISDSCYSGALPYGLNASPTSPAERERFLQKTAAGRSRMLMASGGDEPEGDGGGGHSVFAAALLRGLRKMDGPRFTATELFVGHVLGSVASGAGRIPAYNPLRNSGHEGGDFVFKRIKPVDTTPCADVEAKAALYQKFLDDNKGGPEQQKVAYETGKDFISKYGDCQGTRDRGISAYVRKWVGKYEEAVRIWEQSKSRRP